MSLGSFLKRVTTVPKHGVLHTLFHPIVGNSFADELGAGAGFVLGGPAGAAAGAGLGSLAHGSDLGTALGNAAKFGAAGIGADAALGAVGGGTSGAVANLSHDLGPLKGLGKFIAGQSLGGSGVPAATDMGAAGGVNSGGLLGFLNKNAPALGLGATTLGSYLSGNAEQNQANQNNALAQGQLDLNKSTQQFNQDQATYARDRNASFDPARLAILKALAQRKGIAV